MGGDLPVRRKLVWGRPELGISPGAAKFGFACGALAVAVMLVVGVLLPGVR